MATFDMKALYTASRGDPETQISITKAWLGLIIAHLEKRTSYDTSALRVLTSPDGGPKVTVRRKWLAHIYEVLSNIDDGLTTTKTTTSSKKMTPSQKSDFDKAFDHLDTAFQYIDRAFRGKSRF